MKEIEKMQIDKENHELLSGDKVKIDVLTKERDELRINLKKGADHE